MTIGGIFVLKKSILKEDYFGGCTMGRCIALFFCVILLFSCSSSPPKNKEVAMLYPTPPASLVGWPGSITGATPEEDKLIREALGFVVARDRDLVNHYVLRVVVHDTNFCDANGSLHFDTVNVPNIAGHYHNIDDGPYKARTICLWRGKITRDLIWHEIDHGRTLFWKSVDEHEIVDAWKKTAGGKYGIEHYDEKLVFPHLRFLSRHGTRDDAEDRAEWCRWVYQALWKYHREKLGLTEATHNPLEHLDHDDVLGHRERLRWLLSTGVITWEDYSFLVCQPYFALHPIK